MDGFWGNIFRRSSVPGMHALLRGIPIFEALSGRQLTLLEPILHRRTYAAGEVVFREGDPGVGMYVIERGRIGIDSEATGKRLTELTGGEFFGEIALLNEIPRSATARALTPTVLLGLFQPDLLDLMRRNPRLGVTLLLALAQIAGQRLIAVEEELVALRRRLVSHEGVAHTALDNGAQLPENHATIERPVEPERTVD